MSKLDITKAWKDQEYFNSLSVENQNKIPKNPAGNISMDESELKNATGGQSWPTEISQVNTQKGFCCRLF